jgi:signal transduction histidine kinase
MGVYRQDAWGTRNEENCAARRLNDAVIDALMVNIAVISADGEIVATNKAWNLFAVANGAPVAAESYLHFNYLDVCDKAGAGGDEDAVRAGRGMRSVLRGETDCYTGEYRCDAPEVFRWFMMRVTPVPDGSGAVVVTHEDISEQRRAEGAIKAYSERLQEMVEERTTRLERTQEELVRKERLATLGQFAGSLGHELRNPLGVISNAVYYLQATLQNPDDTTREYLEMIAREVRNSEKIICDLLEISRNRPAEKRLVSVGELVGASLLRQSSAAGVEVSTDIPDALPGVNVDSRQMGQVIDNLMANALQAMPDGGRLMVSACGEGASVVLSVADTGVGIAKELLENIFDPLVTTKARGIGLGLTLSKRLAELNGARLEVKSEIGKGSCFSIVFPSGQ